MKTKFLVILLFFCTVLSAQRIEVSGEQKSSIAFQLEQEISNFVGLKEINLSLVVPVDFNSLTYAQSISELNIDVQPKADEQSQTTDLRGNTIVHHRWMTIPARPIKARITFQADTRTALSVFPENDVPFPMNNLPADVLPYLLSTEQVQSNDPAIAAKARALTVDDSTVFQACRSILNFVVNNLQYVLVPEAYDAKYAFDSGKGNCQNYSHLAAAMLRVLGIPVRIANGITLERAYDLALGNRAYEMNMAQGRHSWVEVYLPQHGWVPFDPQQTEFFISNRYLRIEVGVDNNESVNDGLIRWRVLENVASQQPKFQEAIQAEFNRDVSSMAGRLVSREIDNILLTVPFRRPQGILAQLLLPPDTTTTAAADNDEPVDFPSLAYTNAFEAGNLDFPEGFNFAFPRQVQGGSAANEYQLQRNFLVETAEYATGRYQYAQMFVLEEPILLEKVALALHVFGGSGDIWLELSEDDNDTPGRTEVLSRRINTNQIRMPQGYHWLDFDFTEEKIVLSPGKYWVFLNFSGGPIVNWFYSYGKPVGPIFSTQSRAVGQENWPRILTNEFNYRIRGKSSPDWQE